MSYKSVVVKVNQPTKYCGYSDPVFLQYLREVQKKRFGHLLQQFLTRKDLSGAAFARIVGCSKNWPANIMSGHQPGPASLAVLERWSIALGLNDDERWRFIGLAGLDHSPDWFVVWYWESKKRL